MPPVISRHDLRIRARRYWREYTRMRTAIFFLIGLILIVLVGSFVPQQDTSAQAKVDEFLATHANLNGLGTHLGLPLTQVFTSPLLFVLLGSLYIALGACVISRGRALLVRTFKRYPRSPQYWGEWGSLLFHSSFFLLLVAVVFGKLTGFDGIVTITEGQTVSEAFASYDTIKEEPLFGTVLGAHHANYQVRLDRFQVLYQANGQPKEFSSQTTVLQDGRPVMSKDVQVNDFLSYDNVEFYQQDYGWAPHLVVTNPRGEVVFDDSIKFFGTQHNVMQGVLKVPGLGYTIPGAARPVQLGANVAIFPDAQTHATLGVNGAVDPAATTYTPGGDQARNPVLQVQLYVGDLNLASGRTQNVNDLDTSKMQSYFANGSIQTLRLGGRLQLPLVGNDCSDPLKGGCFTIAFTSLPQYSLFHVKRDTGVPVVYASFGLVMVGLMTKLYIRPLMEARERRRRRVRSRGQAGAADPADSPAGAAAELPTPEAPAPPRAPSRASPAAPEPVGAAAGPRPAPADGSQGSAGSGRSASSTSSGSR